MRREREFKALIGEEDYYAILKACPPRAGYAQTNYYFDTPDLQLFKTGISLRIREKSGAYELTFKTGKKKFGGIHLRNEYTYPLTAGEFNKFITEGIPLSFIALGAAKGNGAKSTERQNAIKYIGRLTTSRSEIEITNYKLQITNIGDSNLTGECNKIVIELDKNEYAGITDYELECEFDSEEEPPELAAFLTGHNIKCGASISKYERLLDKLKTFDLLR